MTVTPANASVLIVDSQFGILIPADLSATIDRFLLCIMMATGTTASTALHVPTALRIGNNMMRFGSLGHCYSPFIALNIGFFIPSS